LQPDALARSAFNDVVAPVRATSSLRGQTAVAMDREQAESVGGDLEVVGEEAG
jgi:hypothetical protein